MASTNGRGICAKRLARHASADRHHDVDDEVTIVVDHGVGVHLQVGEGPPLVEDAEADLRVAGHRERLAPSGHRRHEELVVVGRDVVDDRHGRPVVPAGVAEDAGAMGAHELAPLRREHVSVSRRGERFRGEREQHGTPHVSGSSPRRKPVIRSAHSSAWSISSRCPASGTTCTVASGMRAPRIRPLTDGTIGSLRARDDERRPRDAMQPRKACPSGDRVELAEVSPQSRRP